MEKLINIDGRQVKFKSTGAFLLRYKAQFHRDALKDIYKLYSALDENNKIRDIENFDIEVFYNLVWTLAYTADKGIGTPQEWFDTFSEFPILDILPEVVDMVFSCLSSSVESKKK